MIDTSSILFTAIFVFSMMLIGIVLTSLEFKAMRMLEEKRENEGSGESQADYKRRHSVEVVHAEHDDTDTANQAEKLAQLRSIGGK